jgi:MFS family permease
LSQFPRKLAGGIFGRRMISSMQSPPYRLFFIGSIGQIAAMCTQMMVNPLLMYRLTGSSALLGISSLIGALPTIVIGLFGGALADRFQKKKILVICFSLIALISLAIALALDTGRLSREVTGSWWILMAANFLQGCVMGLMMPSLMAIVPETVSRENLMNAVALNNFQFSVLSMLMPSLAGIMVDHLGFESNFYMITGLYLFGAIFIFFIPLNKKVTYQRGQILTNITNGFKYIRSNYSVMYLLLITMAMIVLSMPFQNLLPLFTDGIFKVGATGLGLLLSLGGVGGLIGALAVALLPNRKRGLIFLLSGLLSGTGLIAFSFSPVWGFSLIMMLIVGLAGALRGTLANTLLQSYTEAQYMGRVMSLTHIQFGFMAIFTFFAGMAAETIQVQWVVGIMAITLTLISVAVLVGNKRIRGLE